MSDFDIEMSKELEEKFDEIMGINKKSTSRKVVDEAYKDDSAEDPFLNEIIEEPDGGEEKEEEDIEDLEEEADSETKDSDVVEEKEESEAEADEDTEDYIPDHLVEAGRAAGIADNKIVWYAENDPTVLEALANYREQILSASTPKDKVEQEVVEKEELSEPEKLGHVSMDEMDLTDMDENTRKLFKTFADNQNLLVDKLNNANTELHGIKKNELLSQQKTQNDFINRIDSFFDGTNFGDVGKTFALTPKQVAIRKEIYNIAAVLQKANGGTLESNLEKGIKAYNGIYKNQDENAEVDAENKLRRKLNKQKTKFSPRPGGQKKARKFKNDDERAMKTMEEKAAELGIDLT